MAFVVLKLLTHSLKTVDKLNRKGEIGAGMNGRKGGILEIPKRRCPAAYRPVVDRTMMRAAMQLSDASTAAIAVLRVMSAGFGVSIRSSSNS